MPLSVFDQKRALITGASSGIGESFARLLAASGCHLIVVARREDRLNALKAELEQAHGVTVDVIAMDLSEPCAPERLFKQTEGQGQVVDVLVNNAGFGTQGDFVATDLAWQLNSMDLMMRSLVDLTHRFAASMASRGEGYVLQLGSIASYLPIPNMAVYAASKSFVRSFSRALNNELKPSGVHVTALNPGGTITEFFDEQGHSFPPWMVKLMFMSAEKTAKVGLIALVKNKPSVIAGWHNAVSMWFLRFLPERLHVAIAKALF